MKIALGQMYVRAGYCEDNFTRLKEMVETAKQKKVDLIVFPKLCISGTYIGDKWFDDEFCKYVHSYNEQIKELSDGIGIVFGNLYYDSITLGKDGRNARYNAIFFAKNKEWVNRENEVLDGMSINANAKDAAMQDSSRYFVNGKEYAAAHAIDVDTLYTPFVMKQDSNTYRIGLLDSDDILQTKYDYDVLKQYKDCDYILCCGSDAWTLQSSNTVKEVLACTNSTCVYVNHVGMQNTGKNILVFDGNSFVSKKNETIYSLNDAFTNELGIFDGSIHNVSLKCENKLLEALTYALVQVDKQMFNSRLKWIVGLSGGIDSSITAALLVKALGPDRIVGYNMASAYNSLTTKNNARILADGLGMELREGSIELLNKATLDTMDMYNYKDQYGSLVYENIQARIRGHLLSTFASIEGGVIINNGNKVEVALGYCTLYGDAVGAVSPLGDLTKVQCFEIARQLNSYFNKEVISTTLIPEVIGDTIKWDMPPSAELKDAQFDPMKWFYHDEIVSMLTQYPTGNIETFIESFLDGSIYNTDMGKWIHYYHLEKGEDFIYDLEWVIRTMANASFKRIQTPPIVKVSGGAFGSDYRESQLGFVKTKRYEELKKSICNM